jgi:hypothetical protein
MGEEKLRLRIIKARETINIPLIGMTGELLRKEKFNGETIYWIKADNDGQKYDKVHLAWKIGDATARYRDELEKCA